MADKNTTTGKFEISRRHLNRQEFTIPNFGWAINSSSTLVGDWDTAAGQKRGGHGAVHRTFASAKDAQTIKGSREGGREEWRRRARARRLHLSHTT